MRDRERKLICLLLGALMLLGALSGCSDGETEEDERFVVRASVCGTIDLLDPAMNTDARAESVFYALYENLLRMDNDGSGGAAPAPGVAKEYREVINFDGTVDYVFTLRSTARWSDGTRVKARDFVYAWRRLADPATGSPNHTLLSMVQGYDTVRETGDTLALAVRADGDTTFAVTLSAPCAYFLSEVCTAVPTMPLRSDAVRKDADWAASTVTPCNGAYQIGVWAKTEYLQLRRNASYYESRAVLPDTLRFVFAESTAEAWRLYEEERVDYVLSPPAGAELSGALPLRETCFVLYNHMSDIFSNEHVRRAFDLVLDRASIAGEIGAGTLPASGFVPYGIVDGAKDAPADFRTTGGGLCPVDTENDSRRRLEAEAEIRVGGYWGGAGFPTVTCLYVGGGETPRLTAAMVAALWNERLGVPVTTEGLSREEFDRRVRAGEYDVAIDIFGVSRGDAMDYLAPFAGIDANNALHYASTPYDLLIGVAESSSDPSARAAFLHDAEALLLQDTALSPIYFSGTGYVLREGLSGVFHDARGCVYFRSVTRTEPEEIR